LGIATFNPENAMRWLIAFGCLFAASASLHADERIDLAALDATIKPEARKHWSFQPVKSVAIPAVKNAAWVQNPIDAFVLAKLEEKGWKPSPAADPRAIHRRVHLDLTGLPPTIAEQEAFLIAHAANPQTALDRVIDELLKRPTYGERWGRHWLDLARYAESNGYERDGLKPSVWRYRDYVINSFNDDKPFDRFIREQLAGDELNDANEETLIATSFLRLGPWDDEPADPATDRFDQLDDMVATTSQVFLGLTLACGRCHDHKFEPLTQHDYYRMVAIFNPLRRPQNGRTDLDVPAVVGEKREALDERDIWIAALLRRGHAERILGGSGINFAGRDIDRIKQDFPDPSRGYFMRELPNKTPDTHLLIRGAATRPGPKVGPGVPTVLVDKQPTFRVASKYTSQRRLSLADWIASKDNPLTARVIVNRVWQFHFGEGLVRTPSDFGRNGDKPTHPELLDYLADWFVKEGWSLKKLHRLIMSSNTYRMSKKWNAEYGKIDPDNRLLWRVPYRRLEVEAIRDSMLFVSGRLNPEMDGPSVNLPIPREALEGNSDPNTVWKADDEKAASRRTIYATVKRSLVAPLLESLDLCDTTRSTAKRNVTTIAPQALMLFNGDFVNQQAKYLTERLEKEAGTDAAKQIDLAYRLTLCRPPKDVERNELLAFLGRNGANPRAPREQMCRVILNLNEFVYPD
jgi:Protein of unknown function (DUF1553)/Protein of unknown function (DUF1549)